MTEEGEPKIIFLDATPEQQAALTEFENVVIEFSEAEVLAALQLVDRLSRKANDVLPLVRQQDKTEALFDAWNDVKETGDAFFNSRFDDATEAAIANDSRMKELIETRHSRGQETAKREIIQLRFAIFAGRLASYGAKVEPPHSNEEEAQSGTLKELA